MKCYSLIILLGFISCTENIYQKKQDPDEIYKQTISDLNIQFEKVYEYEYKFGEVDEETAFLKQVTEFDTSGNIISFKDYHKNKYLKDYNENKSFEYDRENNLIRILEKDTLGKIQRIVQNEYNNGLNTERYIYSPTGVLERKVKFQYNERDEIEELTSYESNGKIDYKTKYSYDKLNFLTSEITYGPKGEKKDFSSYKKLTNNKFEQLHHDEEGKLIYKYIYTTNNMEQVTESTWFNIEDNEQNRKINKFDSSGLLIETIEFGNHDEPVSMHRIKRITFPK